MLQSVCVRACEGEMLGGGTYTRGALSPDERKRSGRTQEQCSVSWNIRDQKDQPSPPRPLESAPSHYMAADLRMVRTSCSCSMSFLGPPVTLHELEDLNNQRNKFTISVLTIQKETHSLFFPLFLPSIHQKENLVYVTIGSEKAAKHLFCEHYIKKKIHKLSSNILIDSKSDFRSLVFISYHVSIAQNKGNSRISGWLFLSFIAYPTQQRLWNYE